jgi:hypothetical protein
MSRRAPRPWPRGVSKDGWCVSKDRVFAAYDGMSHEEAESNRNVQERVLSVLPIKTHKTQSHLRLVTKRVFVNRMAGQLSRKVE